MVRTRNVATHGGDRRVVTNENGPCSCYLFGEPEGVTCLYFQVLRSICLNNRNGLVKRPWSKRLPTEVRREQLRFVHFLRGLRTRPGRSLTTSSASVSLGVTRTEAAAGSCSA